jgi:hypothetical protein
MSQNKIIVLIYHRHKFLDLTNQYQFRVNAVEALLLVHFPNKSEFH